MKNEYMECCCEDGREWSVWLASKPGLPLACSVVRLGGDRPVFAATAAEGTRFVTETPALRITVDNRLDPGADHLTQEVEIEAKADGHLPEDSYYEARLCPGTGGSRIFIPTHWAYSGPVEEMPVVDTHYQHFTVGDGYREQVRTPAVSVWRPEAGITVGVLGHRLAHIQIQKAVDPDRREVACLRVPFDGSALAPDRCIARPFLRKGEKLRFAFFLHPHPGDWEIGMRRWMRYVMTNVVRDEFAPIPWTRDIRMHWACWGTLTKEAVDRFARHGVELMEAYPWAEPGPEIIDYVHARGMKILMQHYLLSYYEIRPEDTAGGFNPDEADRVKLPNERVVRKHPDWCVLNENGEYVGPLYIHMDPNVEAFRRAKVEEAVREVKKGYDGIRYDNALVLDCHSRRHEHAMPLAEATSLMLREIMTAVRQVNPEAAVFINNPGPDLYCIADMHMNESGISSESFLYEQAGEAPRKQGNYRGAHQRLLTLKCLWEFAGKPFCVWDYPSKLEGEKDLLIWRSAIFNVMHNAISGFGGAVYTVEGSREREYEIAGRLLAAVGEPLTDIVHLDNLALRYYRPGTVLILETEDKPWEGEIKIPADVLEDLGGGGRADLHPEPLPAGDLHWARVGASGKSSFLLAIEPNGAAVVTLIGN